MNDEGEFEYEDPEDVEQEADDFEDDDEFDDDPAVDPNHDPEVEGTEGLVEE